MNDLVPIEDVAGTIDMVRLFELMELQVFVLAMIGGLILALILSVFLN